MEFLRNPTLRLKLLLWAIALHSMMVMVGLTLHPAGFMEIAGYRPLSEPFFAAQGGIFHLIMALAYSMAAMDLVRHRCLITFAILVKGIATLFLFSYWIFVSHIPAVLASGFVDGAMALILWAAYISWSRHTTMEARLDG